MSSSSSAIPITRKDVSAAADEDAFGFGTSGSPRTRAHQLLARSPAKAASSNAHSHSASSTSLNAVAYLKSLKAVRERATLALKTAMARGSGDHFDLDLAMLDDAASFVIELGFRDYAVGDKIDASKIPPHSRWRQFEAGGRDRIKDMMDSWGPEVDTLERVRRMIDLTVVSVLVDAGAGDAWAYTEDGTKYPRSEGLGLASLAMFREGLFSSSSVVKECADAKALSSLPLATFESGFQSSPTNPLLAIQGRHSLLVSLASALDSNPQFFDPPLRSPHTSPRPGNMADYLLTQSVTIGDISDYGTGGTVQIEMTDLWTVLSLGLGSIWPSPTLLSGKKLGDVWPCSLVKEAGEGGDLVPFHKLTQWMAYSLVEVLEIVGGWRVKGKEMLTGLPEYRNGGLLIDYGILTPKHPLPGPLPASDPLIIEWRALTIPLLDMIAEKCRNAWKMTEGELTLAKVLEMGTWKAGREVAKKRRGGRPPVEIVSDGTVF